MRGPVAAIQAHGCAAGLLYNWVFEGWQQEWRIEAEAYRLDPQLFRNGTKDVKVVLDVGATQLIGSGAIWSAFTADGKRQKAIVIKGGNVQWQTTRAAPAKTATT